MKRLLLSLSVLGLVAAVAQGCGGAADDLALDASNDQTTGTDSPADVGADATPDVLGPDAPADVTVDAIGSDASDASNDVAPVDGAPDAIAIDAGVGCASNANCLGTEYCEKGLGKCGGKGVCVARPQFCNQLVAPVCGCDKQTYTNECYAHKAGETVAYSGSCE